VRAEAGRLAAEVAGGSRVQSFAALLGYRLRQERKQRLVAGAVTESSPCPNPECQGGKVLPKDAGEAVDCPVCGGTGHA